MDEVVDSSEFFHHRLNDFFDGLSIRRVELEGFGLVTSVNGMLLAVLGGNFDSCPVDVCECNRGGTGGGEGVCGTLANAAG